ncbi:hypothetical protein V8F20_011778 [Naviculisporaceae sp. PSN 640]
MDDPENKHCWECRRRRLVCDSTKPICSRCRDKGIVCPGYVDKKPLTWLTPGKVLSRTWKRKPKPKKSTGTRPDQMETQAIPPLSRELRLELDDIAEALEYYNTCIFPEALSSQLGANHFLAKFTSPDQFPKSTVYTLMSMVLSRRLYHVSSTEDLVWTLVPSPRLYHYRQLAIQTLSRLVQEEADVPSYELISAVYTFMLAVLQQSITPAWRPHFDMFLELITRRGGFLQLIKANPASSLQLFAFWVIGVLANTTTPPSNHIPVLCSDTETIAFALRLFDKILYPYLPCPADLFAHIVTINQLRCIKASFVDDMVPDHEAGAIANTGHVAVPSPTPTPLTVLHRIEQFSAMEWASSKDPTHPDDWLLVGEIYQSAVALLCLLSLEHDFMMAERDKWPTAAAWLSLRKMHTSKLIQLIKAGLSNRLVRKSIIWPVVVAGAAAVHDDGQETQQWIRQTLCAFSKEMGSPLSLVAKGVLEKFWVSGRTGWDDCFNIPCCFVV